MVIYSEVTNKIYNSVEECLAAETKYKEEALQKQEEAKRLEEEKNQMISSIEKAREEMTKAKAFYNDLCRQYDKKYNSKEEKENKKTFVINNNLTPDQIRKIVREIFDF